MRMRWVWWRLEETRKGRIVVGAEFIKELR